MAIKKIVFVGPPASGKTSIRRFFFEGIPADDILQTSESPTIGVKYNRYNYVCAAPIEKKGKTVEKIPVEVVMLDTSGQELERFITTHATRDSRRFVDGEARDAQLAQRSVQCDELSL